MALETDTVIAERGQRTLKLFKDVLQLQESHSDKYITLSDSLARFKIWAGNLGALALGMTLSLICRRHRGLVRSDGLELLANAPDVFFPMPAEYSSAPNSCTQTEVLTKPGRGSLDVRLGESRVACEVRDLLDEMNQTLEYLIETSQEADTTHSEDGVFEDLLEAVAMTITNLMKASTSIRHNPERDPWKRILSIPPWTTAPMVDHVVQKYPKLGTAPSLCEKLGLANSRRRQFFQYRQDHVEKLSRPLRGDNETVSDTVPTTFQGDNAKVLFQTQENLSDDAMTDTTFATAFEADTASVMTIPPPPLGYDKYAVECSLCRTIVSVPTKRAWKKHVYRDLRPYVCLFKDCDFKVFDKRRDWQTHEIAEHRAKATCPICSKSLIGKYGLRSHLKNAHAQKSSERDLDLVLSSAIITQPVFTASMCPFCDEWDVKETQKMRQLSHSESDYVAGSPKVSQQLFSTHVGRHMEQLSLFTLPRDYEQGGALSSGEPESSASSPEEENEIATSARLRARELREESVNPNDNEHPYTDEDVNYDDVGFEDAGEEEERRQPILSPRPTRTPRHTSPVEEEYEDQKETLLRGRNKIKFAPDTDDYTRILSKPRKADSRSRQRRVASEEGGHYFRNRSTSPSRTTADPAIVRQSEAPPIIVEQNRKPRRVASRYSPPSSPPDEEFFQEAITHHRHIDHETPVKRIEQDEQQRGDGNVEEERISRGAEGTDKTKNEDGADLECVQEDETRPGLFEAPSKEYNTERHRDHRQRHRAIDVPLTPSQRETIYVESRSPRNSNTYVNDPSIPPPPSSGEKKYYVESRSPRVRANAFSSSDHVSEVKGMSEDPNWERELVEKREILDERGRRMKQYHYR